MHRYQTRSLVVAPHVCFSLAIIVLVVPLRWVLAAIVASAVHELSHWLALRLCQVRIYSVTVGLFGAKIETEPISELKECVCAAAGPLGGMFLVLFFRWFPEIAICALFQTCYNLLPVFPLDGGRVVHSLLSLLDNKRILSICGSVLQWGCLFALFSSSVAALYLRLGPIPLLCTISLYLKNRKIKFPCKHSEQIVQ